MRPLSSILGSSIACSTLVLALADPAAAQADGDAVAGLVAEHLDVRRLEVDAVVSDRRGRPVTGLERADFEVRVDGEAAPIVNFYAVERRPEAAAESEAPGVPADPPATPPLKLAILVDSSSVERGARNEALDRLRDFLRHQLGPNDRVMLASSHSAGLPPPALTDQMNRIEQGLDRIAATPAHDRRLAEYREILQEIGASLAAGGASARGRVRNLESRIRAFSAEASRDTARTAAELRRLVDGLAGLPGRKALLYLGGGLSLRPGEALAGALAEAVGRYASMLPEGSRLPDLPGRSAEDGGDELLALARHASVREVAFYAVALGDAMPGASFTLARGSAEAGAGPAPGQEESWAPAAGLGRQFDLLSSLQLLAGSTGGLAARGRGLPALLERLRDDGETYYSLAIEPPAGEPGQVHRLEVKVRGRGLRVRHRDSFRALSLAEEEAVRALSELTVEPGGGPKHAAVPGHVRPQADRPAGLERRRNRRKARLPEVETARAYVQALRSLAGGEPVAARAALAELESVAVSDALYDQLEKIESGVLLELEKPALDGLLPVALLYADMIPIYRRRDLAPLAEHALRMSVRLATTVAREAIDEDARVLGGAALTELAGLLARAGRLVEARELFERALDADRGDAVARLGLGFCHERAGDYEPAAEVLEPLAENGHAEARLRLALNLERLGKSDQARPLLEALSEADSPDWVAVLAVQELARVAIGERREGDAGRTLEAALERWPDDPALRLQHAYLLDRARAPRRASEQVERLVAGGATDAPSPRRRYNRWPVDDDAARALRDAADARLAELGRALEEMQ